MRSATKRPGPRWRPPARDELKYLRRAGNRMVRARRRRRTAVRVALAATLWAVAGVALLLAFAGGARWMTSSGRLPLERVIVKGAREARESEVAALVSEWMGRNLLTIDLDAVERKVREHPWIGTQAAAGAVRIQRRLPGALVITVRERTAGGLALVGGDLWLLDTAGLPIDRHGPRYAGYDFPIVKGLDAHTTRADAGDAAGMRAALLAGVEVTRTLAEKVPAFAARVSEIDVADPHIVTLRLEDESYDLRLSREDYLKNLHNYFALGDRIKDDEQGDIEYVDLRWQDRIAVMPGTSGRAMAPGARAVTPAGRTRRNGGR